MSDSDVYISFEKRSNYHVSGSCNPPDLSKAKASWVETDADKAVSKHYSYDKVSDSFVEVASGSVFSDAQILAKYSGSGAFFENSAGLVETVQKPSNFLHDYAFGHKLGNELVGQGEVTKPDCGTFSKFRGCNRVELHHNTLAGDFEGKVFVQMVFHSCDRPTCPRCAKYGWATRQAQSGEQRVKAFANGYTDNEGVKHSGFGEAEHIIISNPESDYELPYDKLKAKTLKIAFGLGIVGGCIIFHAFRFANKREARIKGIEMGWYFSPHFHILGFILGGYGRCRNCSKVKADDYGKPCERICSGCSGFEARVREQNKLNGYIIKVKDKRQTIGGTIWYQANHATIVSGDKRPNIVSWFGVCSCRRMHFTPEKRKSLCPLCLHEITDLDYLGKNTFEALVIASHGKQVEFFADMLEGGLPVWVVHEDHSG